MVALTTESTENILVMIKTPCKICQLLPGELLGIVGHKKAWKLDTHNSLTLPMTSDWMFFWSFFSAFLPSAPGSSNARQNQPACHVSVSHSICSVIHGTRPHAFLSVTLSVPHNLICVSSFSTCHKNCNASLPLSANNVSLHFSTLLICLSLTHTEVCTHVMRILKDILFQINMNSEFIIYTVLTHVPVLYIIPNKQRQDCLHNVFIKML